MKASPHGLHGYVRCVLDCYKLLTYFEYSQNVFHPEWNVWQTYVSKSLQQALGLDSLRSSHPIQASLKSVTDIHQIFDSISYAKGSCVIRMLSVYLGEEVFLQGIRAYIAKHAYGNATTRDLWDTLAETSGKPVHKMMATWTEKVGFPVVTVTEKEGNPRVVHVRQNRFLRTGDSTSQDDQVLFPIFLNVRTEKGVDQSLMLDGREKVFTLKGGDFFKINANQTGLYRTLYPPERLYKLSLAIKDGEIDRRGSNRTHNGSTSTLVVWMIECKGKKRPIKNTWGSVDNKYGSRV